MECEWGSVVKFGIFDSVKLYDSEDKEIEIPQCLDCGNYKSQLIGKEALQWICTECNAPKYNGNLVYKVPLDNKQILVD